MSKPTSDCRATERKHPWPMVRLGDVCRVVLGGTPKTGIPEYWDGDIPWLTPGDMGKIAQMYVDASNCKRKITQLGLDSGSTLCPARSVILSTRAPIGYVFVNSVPMATNQGCKTLVPSDDVYPEYLCFNLLGRTDELNELGTGTTFKELATGNLKAMTLPLPPLSEQKEIVARLERELAAVEKMKKGFEALAETAKAEFEAERLEAHKELLDGDWPCEPLRKHVDVLAGYAFKSQGFVDSGIRICGGLIIAPDRIKWEECKYWNSSNGIERYLLQENDLVIALDRPWISGGFKIGVIGKRDLPCLLIQRTASLRMKDVDFRYVMMLLRDESFKLHCTTSGTTVPHISHKDIETYEIPFPPAKVQKEIVARLSAAKARAEKLEAKAQEGVAVCETMRKAILKEAFDSGR